MNQAPQCKVMCFFFCQLAAKNKSDCLISRHNNKASVMMEILQETLNSENAVCDGHEFMNEVNGGSVDCLVS